MTPAACFREEVEIMKIWFLSHNCITNVGGSSGGHRRRTMDGGQPQGYGISSPQVSFKILVEYLNIHVKDEEISVAHIVSQRIQQMNPGQDPDPHRLL